MLPKGDAVCVDDPKLLPNPVVPPKVEVPVLPNPKPVLPVAPVPVDPKAGVEDPNPPVAPVCPNAPVVPNPVVVPKPVAGFAPKPVVLDPKPPPEPGLVLPAAPVPKPNPVGLTPKADVPNPGLPVVEAGAPKPKVVCWGCPKGEAVCVVVPNAPVEPKPVPAADVDPNAVLPLDPKLPPRLPPNPNAEVLVPAAVVPKAGVGDPNAGVDAVCPKAPVDPNPVEGFAPKAVVPVPNPEVVVEPNDGVPAPKGDKDDVVDPNVLVAAGAPN